MRQVFADSLYWIALSHQRDQWHTAALKVSQTLTNAQIITTDEVLSEFLTAFRHNHPLRAAASRQVNGVIANPAITIIPQSRQSFEQGFALYQARMDKKYSLIDCISMAAMRALGITEILTHDNDFTREGFTVLL
jgi:predicted nucleic acid-binding protein